MRGLAGLLCIVVFAALAQEPRTIEERLAELKYPVLARTARVRGDVRIAIEGGVPRLIDGNKFLGTPEVLAGTKSVVADRDQAEVTIHFVLVDMDIERTPKGAKCVESREKNRADFSKTPIELWIYGGVCGLIVGAP
jgi:hypothetical protein